MKVIFWIRPSVNAMLVKRILERFNVSNMNVNRECSCELDGADFLLLKETEGKGFIVIRNYTEKSTTHKLKTCGLAKAQVD